jgi:ATP-dependent exoDNAse (exonuclease V) alpha subunit
MSDVQYEQLQSRIGVFADPFETITKLYTTNIDVDGVNNEKLQTIQSPTVSYFMETTGKKQYVDTLKKSCLAPEVLQLKLGAAVMCIKNAQDRSYVNGSLGTVVSFEKGTDYPQIALQDGRIVTIKPDTWELQDGETKRASLTQLPLRLAWAITVHKSQGMTLDAAEIDLSRAFTPGMGYVALSRVKNLKHVYLKGMNAMALQISPEALELEITLRRLSAQALADHAHLY